MFKSLTLQKKTLQGVLNKIYIDFLIIKLYYIGLLDKPKAKTAIIG